MHGVRIQTILLFNIQNFLKMMRGSFVLLVLAFVVVCSSKDSQSESLVLRPLSDGRIVSHISVSISTSSFSSSSFHLLPKSVSLLVQAHGLAELRLTLGTGRWRGEHWGIAPFAAAEGVTLLFRYQNNTESNNDRNNIKIDVESSRVLLARIGGMLGFAVSTANAVCLADGSTVAAVGAETMCTENLTPWLAMLPCRDRAGFGTLIDPLKFLAAPHHAIGLSVIVDSQSGAVQLTFDAISVASPVSSAQTTWTSQLLFGRRSVSACPLSSKATVTIDKSMRPDHDVGTPGGVHQMMSTGFDFVLSATHVPGSRYRGVVAMRFLTGQGLAEGGSKTVVYNHGEAAECFSFLEIVPWQFRIDPVSLSIVGGGNLSKSQLQLTTERTGLSVLEIVNVNLESGAQVEISYSFEKAFLHISEHPPDAHHGLYFPAARVTLNDGRSIFTEGGSYSDYYWYFVSRFRFN